MRATILHTNDVHSHFDAWSRIRTLIERARQRDEPVFYVDAGDHGDRSQLDTELTTGEINVSLLAEAGVDAFTPGNNETVVWSLAHLERLAARSPFPWLLANVARKGAKPPLEGFREAVVVERSGVRLGLFGLTSPFDVFLGELGGTCFDEGEVARALVRRLQDEGADIVAALSHLGIQRDRRLAAAVPEIDLIIGGHTHTELSEGERVGRTLIVQTGGFRRPALGCVSVEGTPGHPRLSAELWSADHVPADPDTQAMVHRTHEEVQRRAQEVVFWLPQALAHDPLGASPLATLLAEDLRRLFPDADAGLIQGGLLTEGLPAGPVTRADLIRVCPTMLNPTLVTVTGQGIVDLIAESRRSDVAKAKPKGGGMRGGGVVGSLFSDRLSWKGEDASVGVFLDGRPVDRTRTYRIATDDYIGFWTPGRVFTAWKDSSEVGDVKHELSYLMRDIFREGLKRRFGEPSAPPEKPLPS